MKDYQKKFSNLRILELIEKKGNGKKYVLLEGLKAAKYEWILLTDADCMPFSKDWISSMLSAVQNEKTEIVLGFAPYWDRKSLLAKWIDFETCYTALQYFSAAFWRIPYMGVGRNLLFKRSFLKDYENTIQKNSLSSGDDDLFVNAVANAENTEICMQKDSFMYSEPKKTIKELYIQKTRHYSAGTHYKLKHQILLSGVFLSHIFFWIFCFAGLIFSPVYSILPLILRLTIIFLIWKKFLFIFGKRKLLSYILFFDFFLVVYYLIFSPSLLFFKNKNKWN